MTLIWLLTLAVGAPDIDGINLPVLFRSTFRTSGNYSSVFWNASQTAKALSCSLLLALQKPFITNGSFHRDQSLYFNEIILVKKHFSFQAGFSLKHCLNKRTQTSFVGNYWQMNFQNTLKHVFFQGGNILGKVNASWLTDFSFQCLCYPKMKAGYQEPAVYLLYLFDCYSFLTVTLYNNCHWLCSRFRSFCGQHKFLTNCGCLFNILKSILPIESPSNI